MANGNIEDKAPRAGAEANAEASVRRTARPAARKPKQIGPETTRSGAHSDTARLMADEMPTAALHVPYDENLLERSRTQWQFGDWESLAKIDRGTLQHHPDRAKLALLATAGHLQNGDAATARKFARLAVDWGCGRKLMAQVLAAGVHNSLGRAAALAGQRARALGHFNSAITTGSLGSEARLIAHARTGEQLAQLGLPMIGTSDTTPSDVALRQNGLLPAPAFRTAIDKAKQEITREVTAAVNADIRANNPNPYAHNRTLTPALNQSLRDFAERNLGLKGIKPAYVDYLATKLIQTERNCIGRLATTVQDGIARQLVAECVPGEKIGILEIGALYGISLAILYNHAITRYRDVQIVCLDPFDGYYGQALDALLNQPVNDLTFLRNMRLANVPDKDFRLIKHYSTDPEAIVSAREIPINLIIIDGDHSYEGVKFDFDTYFPILQPGGYVIFDDYNAREWPGVQQFIDHDLQETSDLEYLGSFSRTAVGRKRMASIP
jgi:cephalosporin hydroxylase